METMATPGLDKAILIAGPTASGKSAVALALARELDGVVVNADAMQVYRDLDIVTARPDAETQAIVPHRLYGHVNAAERYSAGRWLAEARAVLKDLADEGRRAIVTGGTGLYFKVLTEGLADIPAVDPEIERHWRQRLAEEGPAALHAALAQADPQDAAAIRASDSQRLVRALAVLETTGCPLHSFHGEGPAAAMPHRLVLMPERAILYQRIEARFDAMLAKGALSEVEALLSRRLDPGLPAMKAIGVPELCRHLAGELSLAEAIEQAKTRSRRYAKRQMTWIRGQMADWPLATDIDETIAMARQLAAGAS